MDVYLDTKWRLPSPPLSSLTVVSTRKLDYCIEVTAIVVGRRGRTRFEKFYYSIEEVDKAQIHYKFKYNRLMSKF